MENIWFYSLLSVFFVSILSFVGVFSLAVKEKKLRNFLIFFVSFSAGALLGDVFIHLLPEAVEMNGFGIELSFSVLAGIMLFFILEKVVQWRHCHSVSEESKKIHSFAYMNLIGDGLHNFIDGMIIAAGYVASIPIGAATTIAVILHEIPQEIGDFGVLMHGGFSRKKALFMNFVSALAAVFGAVITLIVLGSFEHIENILIPLAAGGFIYIAGSDLIPELHKERTIVKSLIQVLFILIGIGIMFLLV